MRTRPLTEGLGLEGEDQALTKKQTSRVRTRPLIKGPGLDLILLEFDFI